MQIIFKKLLTNFIIYGIIKKKKGELRKMKEKFVKWSKEKRIALIISIVVLVLTIFVGITFATFNGDNIQSTSTNSEWIEEDKPNIPDLSLENTNFDVSETEITKENVTVMVSAKLEDYDLYYFVVPLKDNETEEDKSVVETEFNNENYRLYQDRIEIEENSKIYFKYELDGNYSENPYILEINNIRKEELVPEVPENEEATKEELQKEKITETDYTAKYYVIVNYSSNVVTVYAKDANNQYTVPVKAMVCSTGTATPRSGVYKLTTKDRYRWRALFGGVYGQYAVKIVGNILFHSVPYLKTDNGTLEYWEYDKLGTAASAGCVRLTVTDALWIYNNCGGGTQVEFSSNASNPLGKPTARKISGYQDLRGYDPTDPASNNPWKSANISSSVSQTTQNNNNNTTSKDSATDKPSANDKKDTDLVTSEKQHTSITKVNSKNNNDVDTNDTSKVNGQNNTVSTNNTNKTNTQSKTDNKKDNKVSSEQ